MSEPTNGAVPTDVRQNAIILSIEFHSLGNTRAVASDAVQTDADSDALRISKELLDSPELRDLGHLKSEIRKWITTTALPSMLKSSLWLIHVAQVQRVQERLQGYQVHWDAGVQQVITMYPVRCAEAPARLQSLYNAEDYLDTSADGWQDAIREQCGFAWQWLEWQTPTRLKSLNLALFEEERVKAEEQWAAITASAQQIVRERFAAFVDGLQERLTGDGKRLQQRYLDRLTAWCDAFRDGSQNLTNDTALQALVTEADALLRGVEVRQLRSDEALAAHVAERLDTMHEQLGGMLGDAVTRRYRPPAVAMEPSDVA